jgi:hypothetical protein
VQPPTLRPDWLDPVPNYYLYRGYRVTTGKKSRAHILYPNKGTLKMDEDAMVIVQGSDLAREEETPVENIEVQNGGFETIIRDAASQDDSITNASAAVDEPSSQSDNTLVDEKLEGLVVVYQSNDGVSAARGKTVIEKGAVVRQDTDAGRPAGLGLGAIAGVPTRISLKGWIVEKHAIDFEIGWSFTEEKIDIVGDYLSHFPEWTQKRSWHPYLGVGGRLIMTKTEQEEWEHKFGIRFGIGIESIYRQLGLFGEFYPVVDLFPETGFDLEGGLGVRYYFTN